MMRLLSWWMNVLMKWQKQGKIFEEEVKFGCFGGSGEFGGRFEMFVRRITGFCFCFRIKMNFDDMLEELGEMGKFQLITYILVCFPVIFSGANSLSYVFTAGISNYRSVWYKYPTILINILIFCRCFIPTCDEPNNTRYEQTWLPAAIPPKGHEFIGNSYVPKHCDMYKLNASYLYTTVGQVTNICTPDMFINETERCDKFVFDQERTIVKDVMYILINNSLKDIKKYTLLIYFLF